MHKLFRFQSVAQYLYIYLKYTKNMLLAGTDTSGSPESGEANYISLIIGTRDAIQNIHDNMKLKKNHDNMKLKKNHMVRLDSKKQNKVINALDFTNNDISVWCFYVRRQDTINAILNNPKFRKYVDTKLKIYTEFNKIFLKLFRNEINDFCLRKGEEIDKLSIECDSDMRDTVKQWSFKNMDEGITHQIADAVAWCNSHNKKVNGCKERDFVKLIRSKLKFVLLK